MKNIGTNVQMSKQDFLKEHKELVGILKHPSRKGLRKELKEQGSELKREMRRK